ncbi:MAG: class I SAM-dependent methyltransferase [Chloroflexaceae bacterium]|nr:class I SAM-dependent methyltransferase [Chloroflexaceae bacterium]
MRQDDTLSVDAYGPAYFAAQIRKSDAKVAWQYGRILTLAGVSALWQQRVIDVGCGAGPALRYLTNQGALVLGLDHSRYALEMAAHLAPDAGVACSDSSVSLPCATACADIILLSELVEHLTDADALLRECSRVLRPGGRIIVTTPNLWDVRRWLSPLAGKTWSAYTDVTHVNLYTPTRLARALRAAGFAQVRWRTGLKPVCWISSRRLRLRWFIPYPPAVGNGLLATAIKAAQ